MAKLLVIDDEKTIVEIFRKFLEKAGHEVFSAYDGKEGLETFVREKPDVVVTDMNMPGMSGVEVVESIKARSMYTEVLVVTGYGALDSAIPALKKGALDYILKPVSKDALNHAVDNALQKKELRKKYNDMQMQLIHSSKLAAIGTFSAGMFHEMTTPLAVLADSARKILKNPTDERSVVTQGEKVRNCTDRINTLLNRVREFVHFGSSKGVWRSVSVFEPVENILTLMKRTFSDEGIEISLNCCAEQPKVWAEVLQLESVFQNLLVNSHDSFKEIKDGRQKRIEIGAEVVEEGVKITYKDNAAGMPEGVADKMFTSFYTTKPAGVGSGLGMSILKWVIDGHHGSVGVSSVQNEGTTFELVIPSEEPVTEQNSPDQEAPVLKGA